MADAPLVSVRDLRIGAVTDAGREVEIIRGVSFDVAPGEILALIGESGSGKTTIALSLMGHTRSGCAIHGGTIRVGSHDVTAMSERRRSAVLRGTEVSYVPQSAAAAFNPSKRIMDQVVEINTIHHLMTRAKAEARARDLFRALALPDPDRIGERYPHQVSGGQLQRLSAAMALIADPKLVIFDEPTTALDVTTQIEVLRAFRSVMDKTGMAGVYVSHDLAVVAQIADRIVVLKGGEIQEEGTTEQILSAPRHPYTKELIAAFEPVPHVPVGGRKRAAEEPVLEVSGLCAGYGPLSDGEPVTKVLKDVNFRLERGRNLGVIGESGSGKSTLARAIAGILPAYRGTVRFSGALLTPDLRTRSRDHLRRAQIVFQSADNALNPAHSIGTILGRPLTYYQGLRGAACEARVIELLDMVRLPAALRHRLPSELSGGQKQRVNLARALAAEPDLILCDEITSALDTVVAAAILDLLKDLQSDLGLSYLFISHDLSTVEAICDDVLVMYKGEVVEALPAAKMSTEATHPYSKLLISSVPQLDTGWLAALEQDPDLVAAFAQR